MGGKNKRERQGGWKQAMHRFLSIFFGSALLLLALGVLLFAAERENRMNDLAGEEEARLRLQAAHSERQLQRAATDLLTLARHELLRRAAEMGIGEGAGQLDRDEALALGREVEQFASGEPAYMELGLFGRRGRELMHLENSEGEPTAAFPDSGATGRRRSPVDLGELPAGQVRFWQSESGQPHLLMATAVRADGRAVGSLVLAFNAGALLGRSADEGGSAAADLRILDRRGRSLLAVASGERSDAAFDPSQAAPELWQQIQSSAEGQFKDSAGLTSFRTLDLTRPLLELTGESAPGGFKLVAHVSGVQVMASMRAWAERILGYYLAALAVIAFGAGLLVFGPLLFGRAAEGGETGRERHERLLEDGRDLVITAELEEDVTGTGKLLSMNRAATELLGFDAAEIAQMSLSEIVVPDSLEGLRRHLAAARAGRAARLELGLVTRTGKVLSVELQFQRAVTADGGSTVLRGTGRDVSQRKGLEKSLTELEQLMDLQAAAATAVYETDNIEGALAALLARPELDSSGWVALYAALDAQHPLERVAYRVADSKDKQAGLLVDHLPATLPETLRPFVSSDRPLCLDLRAEGDAPFGQALPAVHAACWLFPIGRAAGLPGALLVFTRSKAEWSPRRQEALRQIAGACGQILARRRLNAGLAAEHAALESSRSETAKAGDTLPAFLTRVADRLRLPARRLVEQIGQALAAPGEERAGLETAAQQSRSLLRSIEEILSYAELEAGRLVVAQSEFVWRDLVREALEAMAEPAQKRGLTLRAEIEKQIPPQLVGDAPRVRQVLDQLLGNALRFTEQGEVVLKVQLARETAQGVSIHFTVHDTGCGIPDEQQNSLFAPFGQDGVSASRRHRNGGLGLSLASRLVQAMGGTMWMQSVPGQGSNFHFTCPFGLPVGQERPHLAAQPAPPAPAAPAAGQAPSRPAGDLTAAPVHVAPPPSLRVLVAEESETSRTRLAALLSGQGHRVLAADSAIQAIESLAQQDFDVVFMSVQMKDMDGLTATRAIRDYEKAGGAHLPVVAMSAEAMAGDRARCEAAGMDHYLSKPIDEKELLAITARLAQGLTQYAASEPGDDRKEANVNVDMDLSIFDRAAALDRVGGDLELLIELAGMFMEDCPQLLAEIESALRNGDSDALRASAHTLKGAVGNFSAQNAYDAAYALEQIGRSGDLSEAVAAYRVLKQELDRLQPMLGALA